MVEMDSGRIEFGRQRGPALPKEDNMQRIRRRATEMWEQDGKPDGREDDYLRRAEREVLGGGSNS